MNNANKKIKRRKSGSYKSIKKVHFRYKNYSVYIIVSKISGVGLFYNERGTFRNMEYTGTVQLRRREKGTLEYGDSEVQNTAVIEYTVEYKSSVHNVAVFVVFRCGPLFRAKVINIDEYRVSKKYRE